MTTCKILNLNYLLMLCLLLSLAYGNNLPVISADSPKIINGQTSDNNNDEQCSETDLYQYVEKIKKDIKAKWQPVKGFTDRHVTVVFTVRQNGLIEDTKIIESSGSQEVDQSALTALKAASPLSSLPKGAPEFIQIRYVFAWQVH